MSPDPSKELSHPDELLPWFVNHTLSPQEQREVEDHVHSCVRCQKEIELLKHVQGHVQASLLDSPGEVGLQRLLTEVRKDKEEPVPSPPVRHLTWPKTFAIAASLIIVIQAGFLMDAWFFSKPLAPLSGPQREGIVLQISFVPTATEEKIREQLNTINATVIDGPGQLGIYRIRLQLHSTDQKKIEKTIDFLRQQTAVVGHVALE